MLKNPTHQIVLIAVGIAMFTCLIIQSCTDQSSNVPNPPNVITVDSVTVDIDTTDYSKSYYCVEKEDLQTATDFVTKKIRTAQGALGDLANEAKTATLPSEIARIVQARTDTRFGLFKANGEAEAIRDFRKLSVDYCVPHSVATDNLDRVEAELIKKESIWNNYKARLYASGRTRNELNTKELQELNSLHFQYEKVKSRLDLLGDFYSEIIEK